MRTNNFFIDYETFWGTKYSLRTPGMSYTDFVLDPKFQIHGASVATNREAPVFLRGESLAKAVEMAGMRDMRYVAHNVLFDSSITSFVQDTKFPEYFCTLAMIDALFQGAIGRGLDECMRVLLGREGKDDIVKELKDVRTEDITPEQWIKLEKYANEDLAATQDLYYKFSSHLPTLEHQIMDIILRMYAHPRLEFDADTLYAAVKEADDDREKRIQGALSLGATVEILKGNKLFPEFLRERDIHVPMKKNPKGKLIPAFAKTDVGFQQMLESEDNVIRALAEGRLAVKSTQATTRAYRFKKLHEELGFCPVAYNYARAHTWRLSGANKINMANLKNGSKLRTCVQAPEGYALVVADASQIECRFDGYIAGQDDLLDLFRRKEDPYNEMASLIFGEPIDRKGNPDHYFQGFVGKTAVLGLGFQMGGPKFASTVKTNAKVHLNLDIEYTEEEGRRVVSLYRQKNWKIADFWPECTRMLFAMVNNENITWKFADGTLEVKGHENKIYFPNGTFLYYPMLSYDDGDFTYMVKQGSRYISKYIYGGLLCENIVQHGSRNITADHMVQIAERYPIVMHTYDENIALVPETEAEEALKWMVNIMSTPPVWCQSIPLEAEGGYARSYSK
jgi:DNA polymerase